MRFSIAKSFCPGALVAALVTAPMQAQNVQNVHNFVVSPAGDANGQCTEERPCSPQGAVDACPMGEICNIALQHGVYEDPAINMYYHRTITMTGDCNDPHAVVFRATKPNTALVWVQDHVTAGLSCLTLDSMATGTTGIAARQHAIADYVSIVFGQFSEGTHILVNELSIASCMSKAWISGSAKSHVVASYLSKINLGCAVDFPQRVQIDIFATAGLFSVIDATSARFTGAGADGVRCANNMAAIIEPTDGQSFPGTSGECKQPSMPQQR